MGQIPRRKEHAQIQPQFPQFTLTRTAADRMFCVFQAMMIAHEVPDVIEHGLGLAVIVPEGCETAHACARTKASTYPKLSRDHSLVLHCSQSSCRPSNSANRRHT